MYFSYYILVSLSNVDSLFLLFYPGPNREIYYPDIMHKTHTNVQWLAYVERIRFVFVHKWDCEHEGEPAILSLSKIYAYTLIVP